MWRVTQLILCSLALALAACGTQEAEEAETVEPSVNQPGSAVQPRAVLQVGHGAPITVVRWLRGADNLLSVDGSDTVLLWDVADQLILDRIQLGIANPWLTLFNVEPQEDPDKLSLIYAFTDQAENMPEGIVSSCPEAALRENLWCTFTLDLATREVTPDQTIPVPGQTWLRTAATTASEDFPTSPGGRWQPEAFRLVDEPELANPGGGIFHVPEPGDFPGRDCASSTRCDYGILLKPPGGGQERLALVGQSRIYASDLEISPDGHSLVQINSYRTEVRSWSWVVSTDLLQLEEVSEIENEQDYRSVNWIDNRRFTMFGRGFADYADRNSDEFETGVYWRSLSIEQQMDLADDYAVRDRDPFPLARIIDSNCRQSNSCPSAPAFYAMEPLAEDGDYIGAGNLADCEVELGDIYCNHQTAAGEPYVDISPMADGIFRYHAAAGTWQRMVQPEWGGEQIWALRLSPDRSKLAVLTRMWPTERLEPTLRLRLFAISDNSLQQLGGMLVDTSYVDSPEYGEMDSVGGNEIDPSPMLRFTPDGSRIVFSHYLHKTLDTEPDAYELVVVAAEGGSPAGHHVGHAQNFITLDAERAFELESGNIVSLDSGEVLATVRDRPELLNAGLIAASRLIWGAGTDGRVQFWDSDTGRLELSLYMLPDNQFFAMTPGGRYDSNFGPESRAMRWTVPDDHWNSLAPQTFMRDFYEPGLYAKLLDCREQDNCNSAFRPLPPFDQINRVLPEVEIVSVTPGASQAEVIVTVEAREQLSADGTASSGIYNLRLFRNGRLVAMSPSGIEEIPSGARSWQDTVTRWQRSNRLGEGSTYRASFRVPLPSSRTEQYQYFSAYAFNEDRIKSETATYEFLADRNPRLDGLPRAYVINIGIDGYAASDLQLNYAVSDAELLGRQLARIPGYETRQLSLVARRGASGRGVTRRMILQALQLVTSGQDRGANLAALEAAGIDASMLEAATPDDLVIVTYSGHGWTDSIGNFFLVPSNGRTGGEGADLALLVSSADLSHALRTNQAGEIALITDACFSSAIVQSGSFKPGPLGDAGLGQLAYDKGLLILAASQADNYAVELPSLHHGLLTYALAGPGEGLDLPGRADTDGDGTIRLEEWLAYAEMRLPSLSADLQIGRFNATRGRVEAVSATAALEGYIQRPTFFDFNPSPSRVSLRPD